MIYIQIALCLIFCLTFCMASSYDVYRKGVVLTSPEQNIIKNFDDLYQKTETHAIAVNSVKIKTDQVFTCYEKDIEIVQINNGNLTPATAFISQKSIINLVSKERSPRDSYCKKIKR